MFTATEKERAGLPKKETVSLPRSGSASGQREEGPVSTVLQRMLDEASRPARPASTPPALHWQSRPTPIPFAYD